MTSGLVVSLGALLIATAFGLVWRARSGWMRVAKAQAGGSARRDQESAGQVVQAAAGQAVSSEAAAGLAVPSEAAAGLAVPSKAAAGQVVSSQAAAGQAAAGLTPDDLGAALGSRATLVQFSSAFCAPCRATRRILAEVADLVDGVAHVEIDAESRLDLVRRMGVRRTPTTFVLDQAGQVTHRASGQPRKADVIAALGVVV